MAVGTVVPLERLQQAQQPRMGRYELAVTAFEQLAPLGRHRIWVLEVVLEQQARVAGVQPVDVVAAHL